MLGTVISNASTLREVLSLISQYYRLLVDQPLMRLREDGRDSTLVFDRMPDEEATPERDRPLMEFVLAGTLRISQWLTISDEARSGIIRRVTLRHAAPPDLGKYLEVFEVEPKFDLAENTLGFRTGFLEQPVAYADPDMLQVLRQQADRAQRRLPAGESVSEQVAAEIRKRLAGHMPRIAEIASRLNMSRSTLQRRLADEGASFQEIAERIRRELALELVSDREQSLEEAAFLLGYSEPAAFYHAFKRWTGRTPGAYREHTASSEP